MPEEHGNSITYRDTPRVSDCDEVCRIVASTGFFSPQEIGVAVELVQERLKHGIKSGYYFLFAEEAGKVVAYTCFGPIACTVSRYDLYWIAVQADLRGRGLGKDILAHTEERISAGGGDRVYVETSSRTLYRPTRLFYERCGYQTAAILKDFYTLGDDKVIYQKELP